MKPEECHDFLLSHFSYTPAQLVLKYGKHEYWGPHIKFLAQQLNGLQKSRNKLPTWFKNPRIYYPPDLNLSQSSSELTAQFKFGMFQSMKLTADLTGGFGVDSFFLSGKSGSHHYIEPNRGLLATAEKNLNVMGRGNIQFHESEAWKWLQKSEKKFDLIYIDPSRRQGSSRVFKIADCEPDVLSMEALLMEKAKRVLLKLSPLVDLTSLIQSFRHAVSIWVLAVKNDCKEVLLLLEPNASEAPIIHALNFQEAAKKREMSFYLEEEKRTQLLYGPAQTYIYEPNAAILKAGAFKTIAKRYALTKLHEHTHLYTSNEILDDFPGRCFKLENFSGKKANAISRNHPLSAKQVLKKYGMKHGTDDCFLLAFRDVEKKKVAPARLIKS